MSFPTTAMGIQSSLLAVELGEAVIVDEGRQAPSWLAVPLERDVAGKARVCMHLDELKWVPETTPANQISVPNSAVPAVLIAVTYKPQSGWSSVKVWLDNLLQGLETVNHLQPPPA
jgi:hypothetical protein